MKEVLAASRGIVFRVTVHGFRGSGFKVIGRQVLDEMTLTFLC